MPDETDLPFKAEYSKSNRAACKKCKEKIEKDVLRMAVMVQSYQFDGKTPNWFHYEVSHVFVSLSIRNYL